MSFNYIGIDVSKKVIHVFNGKKYFQFKNEMLLPELSNWLNDNDYNTDNLVFIFEPTGPYSEYLKNYCASKQIKACIINPKKSSYFSKVIGGRRKNDKVDAKMLYRYHHLLTEKDIKIPVVDKHTLKLSMYISSYEFAVKSRVSVSNHLESALNKNPDAEDLIEMIKIQLEQAKDFEKVLIDKMEEYILAENELIEDFNNLLSIPGIGKTSAIYLLCFYRTYPDANRQQITALTGLDVTERTSGTSINGRKKISKNGNRKIRTILYFPTMNAVKYNPILKNTYTRLLDNNKKKKVALIACMRKLVLISHAIYKNKTKFSLDFHHSI